jgi:AraC-like DNA-binding protein
LKQLHHLHIEKGAYYDLICSGMMIELIGFISREVETNKISPMKLLHTEKIKQYIHQHFREAVHLQELAEQVQRSPNYIIGVFKEIMGLTPIEYLHHIRIAEARNLLLNSDMTISEIAHYLGYYDISHFYRTFKKVAACSPHEINHLPELSNVKLKARL